MSATLARNWTAAIAVVLIALGLSATAFAACPPSDIKLGTAASMTVGPNPVGLATADFDGDGVFDLLVGASATSNSGIGTALQFLHGMGIGTFAAPVSINAGGMAFFLATGDFNADGILDVAVTNFTQNTVSVLIGGGSGGVGNGTFGAPVSYPAGPGPHHVAVGDLNADGILDIVVADNAASQVAVLLGHGTSGHGDGTFAAMVSYPIANIATGVSIADVNEDGKPDLLVPEYTSGTVALLHGTGSGTFSAATHVAAGGIPYIVTMADVNADGHLDMLVGKQGSGGADALLGHGDGTFASPVHFGDGAVGQIVARDFDGDGTLDVAFTSSTGNSVTLMHGRGDGTFQLRAQRTTSVYPVELVAGDFDRDGLLDVVANAYQTTQASVVPGVCTLAPMAFAIDHVRDVPNDQGGKLWVTWGPHTSDIAGGSVTSYRVWRRIPAASAPAAAAKAAMRVTMTAAGPVYWEAAAVLPAQRLATYGYTAATAQDSLAGSNPYTAFFVTAATGNADVFWDSPVDSGYSVDNLAPAAPTQVQASSGAAVTITWAPNRESDLFGYRVHRGADRFFTPTDANRVGSPTSPRFDDPTVDAWFYKLAAVDVHGNAGPYVLVEPNAPVGVDVALVASEATPAGVTLEWYADAHVVPWATLQRGTDAGTWSDLAGAAPDAGGRLVFRDTDVTPGTTYAYRLEWVTSEGTFHSGISTVAVPALALALHGARPNPAPGNRLTLAFSLRDASPASIELFDVSGRRVLERNVGAMGAGPHVLDLSAAHLRGGVYMARLTQNGERRQTRIVVL